MNFPTTRTVLFAAGIVMDLMREFLFVDDLDEIWHAHVTGASAKNDAARAAAAANGEASAQVIELGGSAAEGSR